MTTIWPAQQLRDRIVTVLHDVTLLSPQGHTFGRPFLTAYQIAIEIDRRWPSVTEDSGLDVGGLGSGSGETLSRYIAKELARRITEGDPDLPVEGAFLAPADIEILRFRDSHDDPVDASFTTSGRDLSMFRYLP